MAQFDVFRNAGRNNLRFPYVVTVQSSGFDDTLRRLVVPLRRQPDNYPAIAPLLVVENERVAADALLMFAIERDRLGAFVCSLADDRNADAIIGAIDRVITRAYG